MNRWHCCYTDRVYKYYIYNIILYIYCIYIYTIHICIYIRTVLISIYIYIQYYIVLYSARRVWWTYTWQWPCKSSNQHHPFIIADMGQITVKSNKFGLLMFDMPLSAPFLWSYPCQKLGPISNFLRNTMVISLFYLPLLVISSTVCWKIPHWLRCLSRSKYVHWWGFPNHVWYSSSMFQPKNPEI